VPDCSPLPELRTVLSGQGSLESIIADARGRLFYTENRSGHLRRLDRDGAEPQTILTGIDGAGGLAWDLDGSLVLGFNGGSENSATDGPEGGLLRVDPESGRASVMATGMGMANGIVRGPDGAFYASNDFAGGIDRVFQGRVEDDWSKVATPNGLVVDTSGRHLYAAQTFKPASIARIELADPARETPFFEAGPADVAGGPDGMTRDERDRLFVAVNAAGEVWRVDPDGTACALARGIMNASALNWGGGAPGFPARNLYVVAFSGVLIELADATDRPPPAGPPRTESERPPLRLRVAPRRVARRTLTRFRFTVTTAGPDPAPVRGAVVRFGNKRAVTDAGGRGSLRVRFFHPGLKRARASLAGYRSTLAKVRIRR
jgi:sugar lactone lactonase YvrE